MEQQKLSYAVSGRVFVQPFENGLVLSIEVYKLITYDSNFVHVCKDL